MLREQTSFNVCHKFFYVLEKKYEFQTYNVGLNIPTADLDRETRVATIIEKVLSSTADVLLLQGVYGETVLLEVCLFLVNLSTNGSFNKKAVGLMAQLSAG